MPRSCTRQPSGESDGYYGSPTAWWINREGEEVEHLSKALISSEGDISRIDEIEEKRNLPQDMD